MTKTELLELIRNGESSGAEFKRDAVQPERLAIEMAALLNLEGGRIVLGVEDDGTVSGLTRDRRRVEEWVMEVGRSHVRPPVIPYWESIDVDGRNVGVVAVPADSPDKPYKAKRGSAWVTFMRVGSTSREASREEEARLYQAAQLVRYDVKAVIGSGLADLDRERLANYFRDVLTQAVPAEKDKEAWEPLLLNTDILVNAADRTAATVGGLLLFGTKPNRYLPQAGVTATAYPGTQKDYNTTDEEIIRGPLVPLVSKRGRLVEKGVLDRAVDFVSRNMGSSAWLEGGRRRRRTTYPLDAVREAIVNAAAHRDYTLAGTDIEVSLYGDRLEVISPGRLPNGVTVEKMKQGFRAARNELLKEMLRDYGYVEHRGMGVRNRILASTLAHTGVSPDLIEDQDRFLVRLWKGPRG